MICSQCSDAADRRLGPAAHCGDDSCACGHRTPTRADDATPTSKEQA